MAVGGYLEVVPGEVTEDFLDEGDQTTKEPIYCTLYGELGGQAS